MAKNRKGGGGGGNNNKHGGISYSNHGPTTATGQLGTQQQQQQSVGFEPSTGTSGGSGNAGGTTGTTTISSSSGNNTMDPSTHTSLAAAASSRNNTNSNQNVQQQQQQQQQQHSTQNATLFEWLFDHGGIYYLFFFMLWGFGFGFVFGNIEIIRVPVQQSFQSMINFRPLNVVDTTTTHIGTFMNHPFRSLSNAMSSLMTELDVYHQETYYENPSNTRIFSILREAVVREPGGYVHRDLGIMIPAPCGSVRGIGMIQNKYYICQRHCFSNNPDEQQQQQRLVNETTGSTDSTTSKSLRHDSSNTTGSRTYRQDDILIRIPLSFQVTRAVAIEAFSTLIPQEVQIRTNMEAYDDSMYLTLFLAHERGVGQYSKWLPYIASLPLEPTCGYSKKLRPYMLNAIEAYRVEWGVDTDGWGEEVYKALIYAERIVDNMNTNFGPYLETPPGISTIDNLRWALCQVVSRGIAGSAEHGMLRLVPVLDLINHDADAAGIVELAGSERKEDGYFMDSISEFDNGTFVVRSMRHGRVRPLRRGQELMVNYNVPYYTPLDWFVYSGFVPPERSGPWIKLDAVLPPVRRDGPFAFEHGDQEKHWMRKEEELMQRLNEAEALYT